MALPRFLYSTSIHEELLPTAEREDSQCVSPSAKGELTGALSRSKKEISQSPNLPPSFAGFRPREDSEQERAGENRREMEFGGAAVAMELSEPGRHTRARDGDRGERSDSESTDSDDSGGILETMGERRPEKRRKKNGSAAAAVQEGDKDFIGINDDGSSSQSTRNRSYHLSGRGSNRSDPGDYVFYKDDETRTKWEEAALYIREGEDNSKFFHHPRGRWSKLAFNTLHHPAYYISHLLLTVLLMLLAVMENPPVSIEDDRRIRIAIVSVHGVLEILILTFLGFDIVLRYVWFRRRQFFSHKRTLFITIILIVMCIEAITVLARQQNHFRITRALRPFFFIDNYLMNGVRRVLRQIFQSIKAIVDVLLLLLFFVCIFSLLGYYIFAQIDPSYFVNFKQSFVSLFIAMTTANHPDLMMEAYFEQPASPLFFIFYIILTVYCINNVLLAVVYSSFSNADRKKFKTLFLHKRFALHLAYITLATSSRGIEFHDFLAFMRYYRPRFPEWQVMCIFKALHKDPNDQHQELHLEEFYNFYEVRDLKWKKVGEDGVVVAWFDHFPPLVRAPVKVCYKLVKWRVFNFIINLIVLINLLFLVIYTLVVDGDTVEDGESRFSKLNTVLPVSIIFVIIYMVEVSMRVIGVGFYDYFRKVWNTLDFVVIVGSFVCLLFEFNYAFLALWRPVKLFRLLRLKRRYRDIMDTLVVLVPRLISIALLLVVIYYFFAIIGIETLHGRVTEGCCNESLFDAGTYYSGVYVQNTSIDIRPTPDVYYILNFDNILRSYVTLFSLMVINNWFIIMEGFASQVEADWLARIYFMSFVIISLIVLQVIISFIVEAFVFKIQERERSRECTKHNTLRIICGCEAAPVHKKTVMISLVPADIIKLKYEVSDFNERQSGFDVNTSIMKLKRTPLPESGNATYLGRRRKTKDDIQLLMYRNHLNDWIKEEGKAKSEKWVTKLWKFFQEFVEYVIE